jgi:hypothetical protein
MAQNSAFELNSPWPQPDDSGRCMLRPTTAALTKTSLVFLAMIVFGGALAVPPHAPEPVRLKGLLFLVLGLVLGTAFSYRGAFELVLDDTGFTLGKKRYVWADVGEFALGSGRRRKILYFSDKGVRRQLVNLYGMTGQALVEFLNQQRARPGSGATAPALAAPATRKTLPYGAWVAIYVLFFFLLKAGGPMLEAVWCLASPASYATHMLDDQSLADRAGHDARLLPVLLARAHGGDKSAMYFMGDLYDPTDFICESSVPKEAATAIYWYNQAVPLDDQGAERALGALYHYGVGVERDDVMAASLLERAVAHNDDFGDFYLGQMLETGEGEPQNVARAVQLEKASAAQNNEFGETELGRMYFSGIGVPQNAAQAANYWRQAATQGDRKAKALLAQHGMQ